MLNAWSFRFALRRDEVGKSSHHVILRAGAPGERTPTDRGGRRRAKRIAADGLTAFRWRCDPGIGEKFTATPARGTASLTVPIATSPGRAGFGPQLSLAYDSGSGNGPFGVGWQLALPQVTRRTDTGLPRYADAEESDVYILSGAEDLVPVLASSGLRHQDATTAPGYVIHRYRPRIEGLFARIERWTNAADAADVHWRALSTDNILTLYGKNANSRIADPSDPAHIFAWLLCEVRDDKGNAVVYTHKAEDGAGADLTAPHERNRGDRNAIQRTANRYLKRILYGNRVPVLDAEGNRPRFLSDDDNANAGWMFEVVFDYGEHETDAPRPLDAGEWRHRQDALSSYRAGFEVRTCRLCRRVLNFHHFPEEAEVGADCLVRSVAFEYSERAFGSFVTAVTQSGHKRAPGGGYITRSLPPLEFDYSEGVVGHEIRDVAAESLENVPSGVDSTAYRWIDLDGEGLSGVLTQQGGGWFYKPNESALHRADLPAGGQVRFGPVEQLARMPVGSAEGAWQFLDLAGDGQVDFVSLEKPLSGFFERTPDRDWASFRPFDTVPNIAWNGPNLKFIDLTGDGQPDVLITEDDAFTWYPSLGENGFGQPSRAGLPVDDERRPLVVLADRTQVISTADLSGDGLTDIVRIRNGEVCYWPNLGYGRFGAKVTMSGSPWFDSADQFDPGRIRLADIDGSGTTDIIYLGRHGVRFWFNESGNAWSARAISTCFRSSTTWRRWLRSICLATGRPAWSGRRLSRGMRRHR